MTWPLRTLVLAAAFCLPGLGAVGRAASSGLDHTRHGGRDYVRASQWGSSKGLNLRWLRREETLQLSGDSGTLILKADSREAQFNGVQVWLSFPIVQSGGGLYVSQLDCQTALEPILFPRPSPPGVRLRTICLDAGHGGKDPGNQVGSNQEKRHTLLLAQELRDELTRANFKVLLTRNRDTFVDLNWRSEYARRKAADLFVSIHFNSAETSRGSVHGCEVYCLVPPGANSTNAQGEGGAGEWCAGSRHNAQNALLAYQVQKSLTQRVGIEDRGVRRARFAVLREAAMPAILVEAGFMSHPAEGRKIFTAEYRHQLARAMAEGIVAYQHATERGTQ
jgi:N-acetylmuramoyl-L-alanine amidase